MKQKEQASELISTIKGICKCNKEEAADVATIFVDMLIDHTNKLRYLNSDSQTSYWRGVKDNIACMV